VHKSSKECENDETQLTAKKQQQNRATLYPFIIMNFG